MSDGSLKLGHLRSSALPRYGRRVLKIVLASSLLSVPGPIGVLARPALHRSLRLAVGRLHYLRGLWNDTGLLGRFFLFGRRRRSTREQQGQQETGRCQTTDKH